MKKKVQIRFGNRVFSLVSDEPEDVIAEVKSRIEGSYRDFSSYDVPLEEILFVMLANAVLDQIKTEREIDKIVGKLKARMGK